MIYPKVAKLDGASSAEVWVYGRAALSTDVRALTNVAWKSDAIFVAGLGRATLYYFIQGAGQVTMRALPMDENDAVELPFVFQIASGLGAGAGRQNIDFGTLIAASMKLEFVSTTTNTLTLGMFGRLP